MSTFPKTAILSEVAARSPSLRTQAYFQSNAVNAFYDYVIGKILEKERAGEITRSELAKRTHKDRAVISRLMSRPSNITLSTLSDLLLAIGEEPIPQSAPILPHPEKFDWIWKPVEKRETGKLPPAPLSQPPSQQKPSTGLAAQAFKAPTSEVFDANS